jgi:protein-tyrosine phosphatase
MNVLFVCSRNKWRSRTAETIFKIDQSHEFRSAGTENDARIKVNEKLIHWADLIFVMEKRHKQRLQDRFDQLLKDKKIITLDIEDNYQYMDEELIETLKTSVTPYLLSSEK